MNRIKSLIITLENCEVIEIDGLYIGAFDVSGINKQISRIAVNAIIAHDNCDRFFVEIHPDANKEYTPFGLDETPGKKNRVFDRLRAWDDITQIEFDLCTDEVYYGTEEPNGSNCCHYHYFVGWNEDPCNDAVNRNQHTYISKPGWLYILVDGEHDLYDAISREDIDSDDYAKATEVLCDLGDTHYEQARKRFVERANAKDDPDWELA